MAPTTPRTISIKSPCPLPFTSLLAINPEMRPKRIQATIDMVNNHLSERRPQSIGESPDFAGLFVLLARRVLDSRSFLRRFVQPVGQLVGGLDGHLLRFVGGCGQHLLSLVNGLHRDVADFVCRFGHQVFYVFRGCSDLLFELSHETSPSMCRGGGGERSLLGANVVPRSAVAVH